MSDTSGEVVLNMATTDKATANDATNGTEDIVGPDDSVSQRRQITKSDVGSSASTKAAAVAAGLEAAAAHLERLQLLEREEMVLRQRRQALELSARLASANAERDVYERCGEAPRAERWSERDVYERDRLQLARGEHTNDKTLLDILYGGQQQQLKSVNEVCRQKVTMPGRQQKILTLPIVVNNRS